MKALKMSLNPVTIGQCSFEDSLTIAHQAGFSGIGLRYNLIRDYLSAGHSVGDAKELMKKNHLVPTEMGFLNGWMFYDGIPLAGKRVRTGETEAQLLEEMDSFFSLTRGIGSPPITALVALEEVGPVERAVKDFGWLCDQARKYDLKIMLEFSGSAPQVNRTKSAWELIHASGRDNCGLLLDSFLMFMGDLHIDDLKGIPADRIFTIHLADAKPKPRYELNMLKDRLIPGKGVIPLKKLVNAVKEIGYAGYFTVEIFSDEYTRWAPLEIAKRSREALEDLLSG